MNGLIWKSVDEIMLELAEKIKGLRKRKSLNQKELSKISGVSYGSIKRFETSGEISLHSFIKIAIALDCLDQIENLFTKITYQSIEEVLNEQDLR